MTFVQELTVLLNRYSRENASNTPDYILAEYLLQSLAAFTYAVREREAWSEGIPMTRTPAPRRKPPDVMPKRRKINEGDVKPRRPIR